jgi:hypothetical protein
VLPWDTGARSGERFSPSYVPAPTGRGRFDLPARLSRSLYLAESPEHAVAELLHPWRGRRIDERHLLRAGRALALVEIRREVPEWESSDEPPGIADLCDPGTLDDLEARPDGVASHHRSVTQPIARAVWDAGASGLRWWSRFWGDWHTTVLFTERAHRDSTALSFGGPETLSLGSPALLEAARLLGMEV